jgi:hypothetical protein
VLKKLKQNRQLPLIGFPADRSEVGMFFRNLSAAALKIALITLMFPKTPNAP